MQVGVDMSRFREFPYRGSLLQSQSGSVQEVRPSLLVHHSCSHRCSQMGELQDLPVCTSALPSLVSLSWSLIAMQNRRAQVTLRMQVVYEPMSTEVLVEGMELVIAPLPGSHILRHSGVGCCLRSS